MCDLTVLPVNRESNKSIHHFGSRDSDLYSISIKRFFSRLFIFYSITIVHHLLSFDYDMVLVVRFERAYLVSQAFSGQFLSRGILVLNVNALFFVLKR